MSKLPALHKLLISIIAALAICVIWSLYTLNSVLLDDLKVKTGKVENAECYESRSSIGIKLLVNYTGTPEQDFILLPAYADCENIVGKFAGNEISISYHNNAYFGVSVAGNSIIQTEQALAQFNSKFGSIVFVSFMALVFIIALYFRGKHVTSQSTRTW